MRPSNKSIWPVYLGKDGAVPSLNGKRLVFITAHAIEACMVREQKSREDALQHILHIVEYGEPIETPNGSAFRLNEQLVGWAISNRPPTSGDPYIVVVTYYYYTSGKVRYNYRKKEVRPIAFEGKPGRASARRRQRHQGKYYRHPKDATDE